MAEQSKGAGSKQVADNKTPPPLIILNGLKGEFDGTIKDDEGKLVGQIIEGIVLDVHLHESVCDAYGCFHTNWHPYSIVARARTLTPSLVESLLAKEGEEVVVQTTTNGASFIKIVLAELSFSLSSWVATLSKVFSDRMARIICSRH